MSERREYEPQLNQHYSTQFASHLLRSAQAGNRPFYSARGGFVMGEGAGVILIESLQSAQDRGAEIYCEIVGYGASCDAHHITTPAPGGSGLADAMERGERASLEGAKLFWTVRELLICIWDDNVLVHDAGDAAAKFFKDFLGPSLDYNVRLVSILNEKQHYRPTSPEHTPPAAYCGFGSSLPNSSLADGFPILIANESSLDEKKLYSTFEQHTPNFKRTCQECRAHGIRTSHSHCRQA